MIINHNIAALNTYRQLSIVNTATSKSLEKLSSGLRINRAGDDAAGLAISEKMRGQIRGLDQAQRNAQDGISMIQTAEGALNETHSILQRMRELAVQAASDTNTTVDRTEIQKEINSLTSEINRIGNTTEFNTQKLLDGTKSGTAVAVTDAIGKLGDFTINTGTVTATTSAFAITFTEGAAATAGWSSDGATLTVTLSSTSTYTAASLEDLIQGATTNAPAGLDMDVFTVSGTDTIDAASATVNATFNFPSIASGSSTTVTGAIATAEVGDFTINPGIVPNPFMITFTEGTTEGVAWSGATLTVTLDSATTYDAAALQTLIQSATTDAPAGLDMSAFTVTGSGTVNAASVTIDATFNFSTGGPAAQLQIGANEDQSMTVDINDMRAQALGISVSTATAGFAATQNVTNGTDNTPTEYAVDVSSATNAAAAVTKINAAIEEVSSERSKLGAYQNRLEHTINNLGTSSENLTAAESRIRDVDMAQEMMQFTRNNIISQAATAMLAQANQLPSQVLQLLR